MIIPCNFKQDYDRTSNTLSLVYSPRRVYSSPAIKVVKWCAVSGSINLPNMQSETTNNPEWFLVASKALQEIREHAADYEDEEEGDKAPSEAVFEAISLFLNELLKKGGAKLEQPHIFVSPNGQMVLTYGNKTKSIDIRFSPEVHFYFKGTKPVPVEGDGLANAVLLVSEHFKV